MNKSRVIWAERNWQICLKKSAVVRAVRNWQKYLNKSGVIEAVLIDLSKAYHCFPHDLIVKLAAYKPKFSGWYFCQELLKVIKSINSFDKPALSLCDYLLICDYLEKDVSVYQFYFCYLEILGGIPQCSISGPIFFILHKKWSFPLRNSLVIVTKSAGICAFFVQCSILHRFI